MPKKKADKFAELKEIIARLRDPSGCPWDKKQTHASLRPFLVEESYEVLEALDEGSPEKLRDELGDLLLQILLHARIAEESGQFDVDDVIDSISRKLIHRHPHVFGDKRTRDVAEVEQSWQALKQEEKPEGESILTGMPEQMPALTYSQSMQRRVAGVGFDWQKVNEIIDKLTEEVTELQQADTQHEKGNEFGDILFTLANIARRLDIDLETALRSANQRFYRRFTQMEEICRQRGITLVGMTLDKQNELWEEAKQNTG